MWGEDPGKSIASFELKALKVLALHDAAGNQHTLITQLLQMSVVHSRRCGGGNGDMSSRYWLLSLLFKVRRTTMDQVY